MNESQVDQIETRLAQAFRDYMDIINIYEDLKKKYFYGQKIKDLESGQQELDREVTTLREQLRNMEDDVVRARAERSEQKVKEVVKETIEGRYKQSLRP